MAVPNTFASDTAPIPLSQLDANFSYYDTAYSITGINVAFNGTVGVGTTSPNAQVEIRNNAGNATFRITASNTSGSYIQFADPDDGNVGEITYFHSNNSMVIKTNDLARMSIDLNGDVDIGTAALGTTTDTKTVTIASNGYSVLRVNGDYSNTAGEPGGSAVVFAVDGSSLRQGLVSYINIAGTSGDSATAYTGTLTNSMLVGTTNATVLQLGTNSTVALTITSGQGLSISRTAVTAPVADDGNVFSGTYTPTLTNVSNVTTSTPFDCQYMRVGNTVTVSGKVEVTPTVASTFTSYRISLPIASTLGNNGLCRGFVGVDTTVVLDLQGGNGAISADTTNNVALVRIAPVSTVLRTHSFHFTYLVV
jgi:hypothetical protein